MKFRILMGVTVLALLFGSFSSSLASAATVTPDVAPGTSFSLALKADGTVWAWGINTSGQLGDGTTTKRPLPQQVLGLDNVVKISAGGSHALALKSDGTVWAWGDNGGGVLGDGTTVDRKTPVQVKNLSDVTDIAAEEQAVSFAIKSDGTLWTWGSIREASGLGKATGHNSFPVRVPVVTNAEKISTGYGHTAVISRDGNVWIWGTNYEGEVGDGSSGPTNRRPDPTLVNFPNAQMIEPGGSLGLKKDGTLWHWGKGCITKGEGTGCKSTKTPSQVSTLSNVKTVNEHITRVLAVKEDGTIWTWGYNLSGLLGTGYTDVRYERDWKPRQVVLSDHYTPLTGIISGRVGRNHMLAIKNDGSVWSWGSNSNGQLGDGTISTGADITREHAGQVIGLSLFDEQQIAKGDVKSVNLTQGTVQKYVFIPQTSGPVTISTGFLQSPSDTFLNIYDANNILIGTNDDYNNTTYSSLTLNMIAGQKYVIEAGGLQGSAANFTLSVQ
ncbi:RCC1 domain-containing protein [Paenibacillus chitinolyticus]